MARPTIYTDELANHICAQIADGQSLHLVCSPAEMPHRRTVLRWLAANEGFATNYARAKEHQAEYLADEVLAIADGAKRAKSSAEVQAAKLRIEARQWYAKVTAPKKYSDRVAIDQKTEHSGTVAMTPEQARKILLDAGIDPDGIK